MDYQDFVGALSDCQMDNIKVQAVKDMCYSSPLPKAILPLFQDILSILQTTTTLFTKKEKIIIFGIQFTAVTLESNQPLVLNRVYNRKSPKAHLSCSIQYVKTRISDVAITDAAKNIETLVIDFTLGEVVDTNYYLSKVMHKNLGGTLYGLIKNEKLSSTWPAIQQELCCFN
ncbi:MAG: hypothetical protein SFW07_05745 [Gammaproteobacteria bacterium]|nr:hypothetical protein [Gammaproteobacteria bacterium]